MFEDYEPQSTFVRVSCEAVVSSSVFAVRSVSRLVLRAVIRVLIEVAQDEAVGHLVSCHTAELRRCL